MKCCASNKEKNKDECNRNENAKVDEQSSNWRNQNNEYEKNSFGLVQIANKMRMTTILWML